MQKASASISELAFAWYEAAQRLTEPLGTWLPDMGYVLLAVALRQTIGSLHAIMKQVEKTSSQAGAIGSVKTFSEKTHQVRGHNDT